MDSLKSVQINDELRAQIRKLLQLADLVKFAKVRPLADENKRSMETAFTSVRSTLVMPLDEALETEKPTEEENLTQACCGGGRRQTVTCH